MSPVTTVGYGDIVPVTTEGRITGLFLMITGLIAFISFSVLLVSLFYARTERGIVQSQMVTYKEFGTIMAELKQLKIEVQSLKTPNNS